MIPTRRIVSLRYRGGASDFLPIPQRRKKRRCLLRNGFYYLLRGPGGRRMLGHIEVNDAPAIVR